MYAPIHMPAMLAQRRMRLLVRGNIAGPNIRVAANRAQKKRNMARPRVTSNSLGIMDSLSNFVRLGRLAPPLPD